MIKGITEKEYAIIKNILKDYPCKFYAYGSRVKGDFTPLSDLDILIKTDNFDDIIPQLKKKFDQSYLPYVVNFSNFNTIDNKFYKLIEKDLFPLNF